MPKKILVVDDEEEIRSMLTDALQGKSYEVQTAGNFSEGIKCVEEYDPDAILTDLLMSDGDGVQLAVHARDRLGYQKPIILLTGTYDKALEKLDEYGISTNWERYLTKILKKPIDLRVLYGTLGSLLPEASP